MDQAEVAVLQEPIGPTQDGLEATPGVETPPEAERIPTATDTRNEVRDTGGDTGTTPRKPGTTCVETGGTTKRLEDREGATSTMNIF